MKVNEIMTKNVISVTKQMSVSEVAKILRKYKIHGVPVVEGKHLIGIITETDFFVKDNVEIYLPSYVDFLTKTGLANDKKEVDSEMDGILKANAEDIMTTDCITLSPESDVKDLLKIIKEKDIHTVPVVIGGDILKGVVTVADIIKLL